MFIPDRDSMAFLAGFAEASIEASRVRPGEMIDPTLPTNLSGMTLIRPGGRKCYPAVWTQDFTIAVATGFITAQEMEDHLLLIARGQNGDRERRLASGAVIPPYAIPDHVLFDGRAVFYPGTYSSGEDQGGERWGIVPPTNNHYDFILLAHHLWRSSGGTDFLRQSVGELTVIERLEKAFQVPVIESGTGLIKTDAANRAVGFIFCDSIYLTGHLLFASLLRWRAGQQLADLVAALGQADEADRLRQEVARIPTHLGVFEEPERIGGWLLGATEVGRQPDVWGTIYALYLGLLEGGRAKIARQEIVRALEEGTICYKGAVRHVPLNHDASPMSAWERTHTPHHHYQNGAFWHTPTGWLVAVLREYAPDWAERIFREMIAHFQEEDFRKGPAFNAPWECIGPDPEVNRNPLFLGSVAVPYGVLRDL